MHFFHFLAIIKKKQLDKPSLRTDQGQALSQFMAIKFLKSVKRFLIKRRRKITVYLTYIRTHTNSRLLSNDSE